MQEKTNVLIENKDGKLTILGDKTISWKAKGLYCELWKLSEEDEIVSIEKLKELSTDGVESIRSGLSELEKAGRLDRKYIRTEKGCIVRLEYHLR